MYNQKSVESQIENSKSQMFVDILREAQLRKLRFKLDQNLHDTLAILQILEIYASQGRYSEMIDLLTLTGTDFNSPEGPRIKDMYDFAKKNTYQHKKKKAMEPMNLFFMIFNYSCLFLILNSIFKWDYSSIIDGIKDFSFNTDKIKPENVSNVRFSDVKGIDEFREELEEIVEYLRNPEKYKSLGAEVPKGVLLTGPPGTGKTLLAKALAGEAGCKFYYKSGAEFDEVYVGKGASRVRELFKTARENAPSIVFIDEIDSIAGKRHTLTPHGNETINQILTELDGFKKSENVIVIGATNLVESMDPAVKRPGRFDKIINISLPDVKGREEILQHYLSKVKVSEDVKYGPLAQRTTGFSGAQLKNLINIAVIYAIKNKRQFATAQDFDYAYDRVVMGIARRQIMGDEADKRATAYHEIGHALIAFLNKNAIPLYKVTILPKGQSLGHTAFIPDRDMLNMDKKKLETQIDVAMGGRAAEEIFLGDENATTGCSGDLQSATSTAYRFVRQFGMQEASSLTSTNKDQLSELKNYNIDVEVNKLLQKSLVRAKQTLEQNRDIVETLVEELLKRETISVEDFKKVVESKKSERQ